VIHLWDWKALLHHDLSGDPLDLGEFVTPRWQAQDASHMVATRTRPQVVPPASTLRTTPVILRAFSLSKNETA
jgi:hypothetical protein